MSNHAFVPADDEASVVGEVVVEEFEHFVLKVVIEVYQDIAVRSTFSLMSVAYIEDFSNAPVTQSIIIMEYTS